MLTVKHNGFFEPKIISEIRKTNPLIGIKSINRTRKNHKNFFNEPRLSGELLVYLPGGIQSNENELLHVVWPPTFLIVRSGSLEVFYGSKKYRILLRQLHLVSSSIHRYTFLLKRYDSSILILIQTADKKQFEMWVKVIAIELIRHTPLNRMKYFDILTFKPSFIRNYQKPEPEMYAEKHKKNQLSYEFAALKDSDSSNISSSTSSTSSSSQFQEKIEFFESLSRLGRLVHSNEDLSCKNCETFRARNSSCSSMKELLNISSNSSESCSLSSSFNYDYLLTKRSSTPVQTSLKIQQMCLLFEQFTSCNFDHNKNFVHSYFFETKY